LFKSWSPMGAGPASDPVPAVSDKGLIAWIIFARI